jgi:hypothetical protein
MKAKIVLTAALALLCVLPPLTHAAPTCVKGTLESYIALGAEGCIFDNALYYDFTYASAVAAGVITQEGMNPANIEVTPNLLITSTMFPGLNFSASWRVADGQTEQSVIGYKVAPYSPVATATTPTPSSGVLTLDLGPSKVSGIIGSVKVQESTSATTSPVTTPPVTTSPVSVPPVTVTPPVTLEVYDICQDACKIQKTEKITVAPIQTLQITIVVSLSGGSDGASLSSFATDYTFGVQPG